MKTVIENYHGTLVADPFRYLEDPGHEATLALIDKANAASEAYLQRIQGREDLKARLAQLFDYPRLGIPRRVGQRYFFTKNDGLQNQGLLYMQTGLDGQPQVVLDPNQWSEDGTIALTNYSCNKDGSLLAYTRSESGSDWQTIHIRDLDTGQDLPDVIRWCKFTGIAWLPDASGSTILATLSLAPLTKPTLSTSAAYTCTSWVRSRAKMS